MNSLIYGLMPIFTSLPGDLQGVWDYNVLGLTTVGAIVVFVGGMAFTLIKARAQRKAVDRGLKNNGSIQDVRYEKQVKKNIELENEIKELKEDMYVLAKSSVRPEAKSIVEKYEHINNKVDIVEKIEPIVNEVVKVVKKRFK